MTAVRGMSNSAPLDPDAAQYLLSRGDQPIVPFNAAGIKMLRRRLKTLDNADRLPHVEVGHVVHDSVAGRTRPIPLRRYLSDALPEGPQPVILFFHGGGWVAGDLDSHDAICRQMVKASGTQLIAVDYRLAPEHPFPAAVEDAIDSYAMLLARANEWSIDTDRIAVMGDGTGGTLASVVSIHARDMCQPVPVSQLLFYPVTDMVQESASFTANVGPPGCMTAALPWLYGQYLGKHGNAGDWRASPLHVHSMAGMPPTFIAVGDRDPLYDEAVAFADRLYKAGVATQLRALPGQIHDYLSIGGVIGEAKRSLDAAAGFLRTLIDARPSRRRRSA
ncbi:alpha/beta hydrolase [Sphingobium aromaticivastans]|uniref:alpha/beta hydrolase n=1 Tax=Sphingobium aromaticivastans TaxID=1778665 RepID=UPI003015D48C